MSTPVRTIHADPAALMRSILKRIATGPELSKDISREEACAGMRCVLEGQVDAVQAGIFLIALRMKRESDDENRGVLEAILEATRSATAPVDEVVDIGDPYDVDLGPEDAAARVGDPGIGWAYIDQKAFCPKLYDLAALRTLIVKRPAITTAEVLAGPVRGRVKTHLVTGYVHKPYPRIYALLARHAGFDSALIVRGVEGGVIPSLTHTGKAFHYHGRGEETSTDFTPAGLGIDQSVRAPRIPGAVAADANGEGHGAAPLDAAAVARAAGEAGMAALAGQPGATRDSLVYGAALCLWHLERHGSLKSAADAARAALDSGKALEHLRRIH